MPWTLIAALVSLVFAPFVANYVTHAWQEAAKQRDLDLRSLEELYALYGEFCAVWKLSRAARRVDSGCDEINLDLVNRASVAEGRLESLLVRIAAERSLNSEQLDRLGALRQVYQRLRESLLPDADERRDGVQSWTSAAAPGYVALKALIVDAAWVLSEPRRRRRWWWLPTSDRPSSANAAAALLRITSNRLEHPTWVSIAVHMDGVDSYVSDLKHEVKTSHAKRRAEAEQELALLEAARTAHR